MGCQEQGGGCSVSAASNNGAVLLFVSEFVSALVSFQMLFAPTPVDLEIAER